MASEDISAVLADVVHRAGDLEVATNLQRASRYELLGVVERLRAWHVSKEPRALAECEIRLGRLLREVDPAQAALVGDVAEVVYRARGGGGSGPTAARAVSTLGNRSESVELLYSCISGLKRAFRRWPTGDPGAPAWPIENEDAVQRLVWLALAPVFEELRFEEPVGSVGPPRWRPDFALPSLAVAVEVKFVRSVSHWPATYRALVEDDGYCRSSGSPFGSLAIIVWDASRSTERHAEWESTLLQLASVEAVAILPRPGGD